MRTTIEELYYGNVMPYNRSVRSGSEYANLVGLLARNEEEQRQHIARIAELDEFFAKDQEQAVNLKPSCSTSDSTQNSTIWTQQSCTPLSNVSS